mgnify:CR=1 FL=1
MPLRPKAKTGRTDMEPNTPLYPLLAIDRLRMESDGKGVTTLVAGAGCPLRCRWCINARLLKEKQPERVSPQTLFERTRVDNLYFQATGGGLCFGGGESLLHADFIAAFRALIGGAWKLTVETSLNVSPAALQTAIQSADAFIVDVKTADPELYRRYTGGENQIVFENLKTLLQTVPPENVKVRVPLIPEFNNEADQAKTETLLRSMGAENVELFSYKRTG